MCGLIGATRSNLCVLYKAHGRYISHISYPLRMIRPDDLRLGTLNISCNEIDSCKRRPIGLIQVPCDEGVLRNGGRPGASEAPSVVMNLLPRLGCIKNREVGIDMLEKGVRWVNYGSIGAAVLETVHANLRQMVFECLQQGCLPVCIGGGNDQSWPNGAGWIDFLRSGRKAGQPSLPLTVINVDAHLDVRPMLRENDPKQPELAHSGSPFRQLVEWTKDKDDFQLIEFAAQGSQCSSDHVDYVLANGGQVIWLSKLRAVHGSLEAEPPCVTILRQTLAMCERDGRHVFFSFDLDAIRASDCPGVSCPSPIGLTSDEALQLCFCAGASKAVEIMDMSEFNPRIESDRTARLAVNMIYQFMLGYATRDTN